jgi:hypothetical protein
MVSLSPQARWKLNEFLDAVNAPKKGKAVGSQFIGKYVKGSVIHDTWEGRDTAKLDSIMAVPANAMSQISMQLDSSKEDEDSTEDTETTEESAETIPTEEELAALEETLSEEDEAEDDNDAADEETALGEAEAELDVSGIGSTGLPEDVKPKVPVKPPF